MSSSFLSELKTVMTWSQLSMPHETLRAVEDIKSWLKHSSAMKTTGRMDKKPKPGYRSLFSGSTGTAKEEAAALIGRELNKPVYKADLSILVSKYIGETEKNIDSVFKHAEEKETILFIDKADTLFGKRTGVKDAHDKYANQEVSCLLQRMENFNGLVILATNKKNNIDPAFTRRFNSIVHFPG